VISGSNIHARRGRSPVDDLSFAKKPPSLVVVLSYLVVLARHDLDFRQLDLMMDTTK
jgi:hypothetical protein